MLEIIKEIQRYCLKISLLASQDIFRSKYNQLISKDNLRIQYNYQFIIICYKKFKKLKKFVNNLKNKMSQICSIHQSEFISLCVDKSCSNRSLICQVCARESHMTHVIIPFQEFCDFLYNDIKASQTQSEFGRDIKNQEQEIAYLLTQLEKIIKSMQTLKSSLQITLLEQNDLQKRFLERKLEQFQHQIKIVLTKQEGYQEIIRNIISEPDSYTLNDNNYLMQIQFTEIEGLKEKFNDFSEQFKKYRSNVCEYFQQIEDALNKVSAFKGPQIEELDESFLNYQSHISQQKSLYQNKRIYEQANVLETDRINWKNRSVISASNTNNPPRDDFQSSGLNLRNSSQKLTREEYQNQMLSPQQNVCKFRFQPNNKKEFQSAMQEIIGNQGIKSLWIDFPIDSGINEIRYLIQVLKLKQNIKKIFLNFPKSITINSLAFQGLFDCLKNLSSVEILSLKMKKCQIEAQFSWDTLLDSIYYLSKKNLQRVLLLVSDQTGKEIKQRISYRPHSNILYELIDFN
ncbi:hypothetical protein TTHERM_01285910 (macronuclear) [Tetrahymena thermophila SB210]|uniref:Uncharacterized protein n=1 Tax=Tetrahymena thermophila (strain SB210) TaxID=312017 RepID=Q22A44_TETTS|nr:hypothetical protein TTHERM_01285910 [Tetrahymena thermophila SB210]EAR82167.3 hypothetical protein TTHERM_01285910 [Tetrahymena thermophila SB210]|eukprot:XP_001029830.3 hypothetical protein TTHERM_01285910 [Tetrahymena thermophila SB210]